MLDQIKDYYGKTLQSSADLQTDACCTIEEPPAHIKAALGSIHEEVSRRYYGCGLVVPECLAGLRVLDLGCGAGRDAYLLSALVGENGYVVGVDMTDEQLAIARKHIDYHTTAYGYISPNLEFRQGYIEQLDQLKLEEQSFDLIISNCVINLSPDKQAVLQQAYNLLKPGGEMYFSDVYSDRRIPDNLVQNELLYGECLSGALYWNDFIQLAKHCGFTDPRLVEDRPLTIENEQIQGLVNPINFYSATYRLFKLGELEPTAEDYGQAVTYKGDLSYSPDAFKLDKHHVFEKEKSSRVSGNTFKMLKHSRFAEHFLFSNADSKSPETHRGAFTADSVDFPFDVGASIESSGCC